MIAKKVDYVIPGNVRVNTKDPQKKSPRVELLENFAHSLGEATLVSEVGEFEFEYLSSRSSMSALLERGNVARTSGAGWHIKQKSPFEL
jgi:hypothetical protein